MTDEHMSEQEVFMLYVACCYIVPNKETGQLFLVISEDRAKAHGMTVEQVRSLKEVAR